MIIFYNHSHNGDIHYSREFVKDIIKKTNHDKYIYQHKNGELLKDINLIETNIIEKNKNEQIIREGNKTFINTWIGQKNGKFLKSHCTLHTNYNIYKEIYKQLNIEIEDIKYYIPEIDFKKYNIYNVDIFLSNNKNMNILISNGNVESGQAINFDFTQVIKKLANEYKNINFILTNKCNIVLDNVFFTDDIMNKRPDLNEISYLSTFCDIIVGRSSGPYTFTHIKENLFNKKKKYIDFGNYESHVLWYGSDIFSKSENIVDYVWKHINNLNDVYNIIKREIEKL
jgi:hypothetical protein